MRRIRFMMLRMNSKLIMKDILRLGVVSAFVLFGVAFAFSGRIPHGLAASEVSGSPRSLYVQHCARCHGSDGRADTAKGRELDADDLTSSKVKGSSTSKIIRVITNGKGDMPRFGRKLTPAQIRSITGYIRSL